MGETIMDIITHVCDVESAKDKDCVMWPKWTPSHWVSESVKITPVIRMEITYGGGSMSVPDAFAYAKEINGVLASEAVIHQHLTNYDKQFTVITDVFSGKNVAINTQHIVTCELFHMATAIFYNENTAKEIGYYRQSMLIQPGVKVELGDLK